MERDPGRRKEGGRDGRLEGKKKEGRKRGSRTRRRIEETGRVSKGVSERA